MAQAALAIKSNKIGGFHEEHRSGVSIVSRERASPGLYFPAETVGMRTRFRTTVLNYIFRTALDLAEGSLESAEVAVSSTPDEEDSLILDLTMVVNADWEIIGKLRYEVLAKLSEWAQEWSDEEKDDYGRRIYFGFLPSTL